MPFPCCLRPAGSGDFSSLRYLEHACFPASVRESDAALRRSLSSSSQEVWLMEEEGRVIGALVLRLYAKTLRIFSLAVDPDFRGRGLGGRLLARAVERARERGAVRIVLEVNASDRRLVGWYTRQGFHPVKRLPGYYGAGSAGLRMQRRAVEPSL